MRLAEDRLAQIFSAIGQADHFDIELHANDGDERSQSDAVITIAGPQLRAGMQEFRFTRPGSNGS